MGGHLGAPSVLATPSQRTAVVIGASMAGLFAAAAFAPHGWTVQVLERDDLAVDPQHRRGIPQDPQAHVLLHRGMIVIDQLVPGFRDELLARDAVPYDSGRMPWLGEYGWLHPAVPGMRSCRRPGHSWTRSPGTGRPVHGRADPQRSDRHRI